MYLSGLTILARQSSEKGVGADDLEIVILAKQIFTKYNVKVEEVTD